MSHPQTNISFSKQQLPEYLTRDWEVVKARRKNKKYFCEYCMKCHRRIRRQDSTEPAAVPCYPVRHAQHNSRPRTGQAATAALSLLGEWINSASKLEMEDIGGGREAEECRWEESQHRPQTSVTNASVSFLVPWSTRFEGGMPSPLLPGHLQEHWRILNSPGMFKPACFAVSQVSITIAIYYANGIILRITQWQRVSFSAYGPVSGLR